VRCRLEQGDIVCFNNRIQTHDRTGYTDVPGHVRCLQRMWIRA